jgi:FtsP/CotA-like multicopper oxidase with cupredoxin domain
LAAALMLPGRFVFHCHALEHGDFGTMVQMEVER